MQLLDLARGEADLALRVRPPNQPDLQLVHTLETANAVHVAPALARTRIRLLAQLIETELVRVERT